MKRDTRPFLSTGTMFFPAVTAAMLIATAIWLAQWNDSGAKYPVQATQSAGSAAAVAPQMAQPSRIELQKVKVSSAAELDRLFDSLDYTWPPQAGKTVPRIAVEAFPADLDRVSDSRHRKSLFFRALLPIVLAENDHIRQERDYALHLLENGVPEAGTPRREWLDERLTRYRIRGSLEHKAVRDQLLQRLDVVPTSLALAQAASESGWGMSRFAQQGNNLFGHVTSNASKGMVPTARPEGLTHAMRTFPTVRESVRAYVSNLNTSRVYSELWRLRERMRVTASFIDPMPLAAGLMSYSVRGQDYVDDIRTIISNNRLTTLLRHVDLRPELKLADAAELVAASGKRRQSKDG